MRTNIKHRIDVPDSSAITTVGFDPETNALDVDFIDQKTGEVKRYRYGQVPHVVYCRLLNADSMGKFVNETIKPNFRSRRVKVTA